jgi:hypothetical protein
MIGNYLIVPLQPSPLLVLAQIIANVQHQRVHLLHLLPPSGSRHTRAPVLPEEQILFPLFALDSVSDASGSDLGLGVAKRLSGGSPQQIRLKGDPSSSAAFSESEESGVAEMKPKEKGRKPDGIDQKAGQNVQKVSNMVPPTKKNKLASREERGDGVRRQGRTGRNFPATRSLTPMTSEKLGNIGTVKQLRSSRLGFEKSERLESLFLNHCYRACLCFFKRTYTL